MLNLPTALEYILYAAAAAVILRYLQDLLYDLGVLKRRRSRRS